MDTQVSTEMRSSFLSYAMSVVVSRALPDVRDGLKPVHRRILYSMSQMGVRPDKPHVKCAKVVGDVMGNYHPHGDSAIYEALVRLAQDFSMRLPLVDGHGNFGTHCDPPAAARYTECRMATSAVAMTAELGEDTVDFRENYDGTNTEPKILPAAFPNLIVNGSEGIAVGMATRMAPHNLGEAVAACQYLLEHPDATVEDMIAIIPGPDLPTGGIILNVAGAHEAYRTGRGAFRIRARATIEDVSARRKAIVVTELPYQVGPEHVITRIKALRDAKRLPGVFNVIDLSDMRTGMRLVIETKTGYNPHAVLAQLYALTPLEESFTIHALALVGGFPRTLNLLELVQYYVDHRLDVTRRRCEYRRRKAAEQAHLLEGYLVALARIEEVVATIRAARDTAAARTALMASYLLSAIQASAILEMPLRRLTSLEVEKITTELADLHDHIAELTHLLSTQSAMNALVSGELAGVAGAYGTPRASTIATEQESADAAGGAVTMEIPDEPVRVTLSTTGLVAAWKADVKPSRAGSGDVLAADLATTTRATLGAVTNTGRLLHVSVVELPAGAPASRGVAVGKFVDLVAGERVLTLVATGDDEPPVALATAAGVIKRVAPKDFAKASGESIIGLKDGDEVVSAAPGAADGGELVLVTSDAQLLRFPADSVRAQGRSGGGVAGIRLSAGASVLTGAYLPAGTDAVMSVLTVTDTDMAKVAPLSSYPAKGRGTGGVRAMRFTRGSTALVVAAVATTLAAGSAAGPPVALPPTAAGTRDGAGVRVPGIAVAGAKR